MTLKELLREHTDLKFLIERMERDLKEPMFLAACSTDMEDGVCWPVSGETARTIVAEDLSGKRARFLAADAMVKKLEEILNEQD